MSTCDDATCLVATTICAVSTLALLSLKCFNKTSKQISQDYKKELEQKLEVKTEQAEESTLSLKQELEANPSKGKLEIKLEKLLSSYEELSRIFDEVNGMVAVKDDQIKLLNQEMESNLKVIKDLQKNVGTLDKQLDLSISLKKEQLASLTIKFEDTLKSSKTLEEKLIEKESEILSLKDRVEVYINKISNLEKELLESKESERNFLDLKNRLESEKAKLEIQILECSADYEESKRNIENLRLELKKILKEKEELQYEIRIKEEKINALQKDLEELKQVPKRQTEEFKLKFELMENNLKEKQDKIDLLEKENLKFKDLEIELKEKQERIHSLEIQVFEFSNLNDQLNETYLKDLESKLKEKDLHIENLNRLLEEYSKMIVTLEESVKSLEKKLLEPSKENLELIISLQESKEKLESQLSYTLRENEQLKESKRHVKELQEKISAYEIKIADIESNIRLIEESKTKLQVQLLNSSNSKEKDEQMRQNLEIKLKEKEEIIESLTLKLEESVKFIASLEIKLSQSAKLELDLKDRIRKLEEALNENLSEKDLAIQQLDTDVKRLLKHMRHLEGVNESLQKQTNEEVDKKQKEIEVLKSQLESITLLYKELEVRVKETHTENTHVKLIETTHVISTENDQDEIRKLEESNKSLQNLVLELRSKLDQSNRFEKLINDKNEELSQLRLKITHLETSQKNSSDLESQKNYLETLILELNAKLEESRKFEVLYQESNAKLIQLQLQIDQQELQQIAAESNSNIDKKHFEETIRSLKLQIEELKSKRSEANFEDFDEELAKITDFSILVSSESIINQKHAIIEELETNLINKDTCINELKLKLQGSNEKIKYQNNLLIQLEKEIQSLKNQLQYYVKNTRQNIQTGYIIQEPVNRFVNVNLHTHLDLNQLRNLNLVQSQPVLFRPINSRNVVLQEDNNAIKVVTTSYKKTTNTTQNIYPQAASSSDFIDFNTQKNSVFIP